MLTATNKECIMYHVSVPKIRWDRLAGLQGQDRLSLAIPTRLVDEHYTLRSQPVCCSGERLSVGEVR